LNATDDEEYRPTDTATAAPDSSVPVLPVAVDAST